MLHVKDPELEKRLAALGLGEKEREQWLHNAVREALEHHEEEAHWVAVAKQRLAAILFT